MHQRVQARGFDFRVLGRIEGRVEARAGAAPFRGSGDDVMEQRIDAGRANIGVVFEIPGRFEERVRVAAFGGARVKVVLQRIDASLGDVRVGRAIPFGIEEAAAAHDLGGVRRGSRRRRDPLASGQRETHGDGPFIGCRSGCAPLLANLSWVSYGRRLRASTGPDSRSRRCPASGLRQDRGGREIVENIEPRVAGHVASSSSSEVSDRLAARHRQSHRRSLRAANRVLLHPSESSNSATPISPRTAPRGVFSFQ